MGEKPMGTPPAEDEDVDPTAGAAGINTTRDNISRNPRPSAAGLAGMAGEPIPGIDVKLGTNK